MIRDGFASFLLLCGVFLCAVSLYGVFRFQNSLNRLHAAAVGSTLGMALLIFGLCIKAGSLFTVLKLLLVLLTLWLTVPVASNRIAKMELALRGLAPKIIPGERKIP